MNFMIMGNDDFILYIRKKQKKEADSLGKEISDCYPNNKRNTNLGKIIWEYIESNSFGKKIDDKGTPCIWNSEGCNDDGYFLPKTAVQFEIKSDSLPHIFNKLDDLIDKMK